MPFTYLQTKQIKEAAISKNLELWKDCDTDKLFSQLHWTENKTDKFFQIKAPLEILEKLNYDPIIKELSLDNLLPWLNKIFDSSITIGGITEKATHPHNLYYFTKPQKLCDMICNEINNSKNLKPIK